MIKIDPDFWKDVENPDKLKYVVYGDTDSLYIHAPTETYTNPKEALDKADTLAVEINNIITNVLNSHLLIKMNVDRNYNKTFFKTESVISKMMLLEAKKNYAYVELGKKGKVNKELKVKYTGIPVVRSDYSKFAQDFIRYLIEDVAFSESELNHTNISDKISEIIETKQSELKEYLKNYDFKYIATPGRWKLNNTYTLEPFVVIGMRLYNTIMDQEIFRPGINGLSIPIKIVNEFKFREELSKNANRSKYFIGNTPMNKINYIVIPTNYENEIIREKFIKFCIQPDSDIIWDKLFGTVAKNIARLIKQHYESV
jgi:hypothetical protein